MELSANNGAEKAESWKDYEEDKNGSFAAVKVRRVKK